MKHLHLVRNYAVHRPKHISINARLLRVAAASLEHRRGAAMYSSTSRLVAAVVMTLTVTACGDGHGTIATATAPTPMPAPRSTFALFGMVSEVTANGIVPVEGVGIQVMSCDPSVPRGCGGNGSMVRVATNAQGTYIVEGVYPGPATVWVEKPAFQIPEGVRVDGEGALTVTVNGDTRLDVQLVRR